MGSTGFFSDFTCFRGLILDFWACFPFLLALKVKKVDFVIAGMLERREFGFGMVRFCGVCWFLFRYSLSLFFLVGNKDMKKRESEDCVSKSKVTPYHQRTMPLCTTKTLLLCFVPGESIVLCSCLRFTPRMHWIGNKDTRNEPPCHNIGPKKPCRCSHDMDTSPAILGGKCRFSRGYGSGSYDAMLLHGLRIMEVKPVRRAIVHMLLPPAAVSRDQALYPRAIPTNSIHGFLGCAPYLMRIPLGLHC